MRFSQFKPLSEQRLDEINMSPASLRQLASKIEGAKAGLEFELVVRRLGSDEDQESEPDFDADESCTDFDDIIRFFSDNDYNSRRDLLDLRGELEEQFSDWAIDKAGDEFDQDALIDGLTEYFEGEGLEGEELSAAIEEEMNDQGRVYDMVRDAFIEDKLNSYDHGDFLSDQGWTTMQDILHNFDIQWPYYTYGSTGDLSAEDAADSFSRAVGREVKVSGGYHSGSISRQDVGDDFYIAEPDSSIEGDDSDDGGLEFVSPPLSISEMLNDLKNVVKWCNAGNAYTNESTGLHMNISVPNYSQDKLDFIKLAVLMGDDHVSSSFGRLGAHYAKSAMAIIKRSIAASPANAAELLVKMRNHLSQAASKAIHSGRTDKYTSINVKDGRVEFRSPGGDWVSDFGDGKVENTLLRFVVALDAACDESKYKDEYAKKLYKLLAPADPTGSTIKFFAEYAAGRLPQSAMKSLVKQTQSHRKVLKAVEAGMPVWWKVTTGASSVDVVGRTEEDAKYAAAKAWGIGPSKVDLIRNYVAAPIRELDDSQMQEFEHNERMGNINRELGTEYEVYNRDTERAVYTFKAGSPQEAHTLATDYCNQHALSTSEFNVRTVDMGHDARRATGRNNPPVSWRVANSETGESVYVPASDEREAVLVAAGRYANRVGSDSSVLRAIRADAIQGQNVAEPTPRQPRAAELPPEPQGEQLPWWQIVTASNLNGNIQARTAEEARAIALRDWGQNIETAGGITHIRLISGLA